MPQAAERPTGPARGGGLTGFYTAVGTAAALVGLGVCLRRPLALGCAIHKVRAGSCPELPGIRPRERSPWLELCLEAARAGNRPAMEALVHASRPAPAPGDTDLDADFVGPSRLYLAAEARPEILGACLARLDNRRAREVVEHLTLTCLASEVGDECDAAFDSPARLAAELRRLSRSDSPRVARVARAVLDFVRRRFPPETMPAGSSDPRAVLSEPTLPKQPGRAAASG